MSTWLSNIFPALFKINKYKVEKINMLILIQRQEYKVPEEMFLLYGLDADLK